VRAKTRGGGGGGPGWMPYATRSACVLSVHAAVLVAPVHGTVQVHCPSRPLSCDV